MGVERNTAAAPGTWHSYSNSNYSALALIVERAGRARFSLVPPRTPLSVELERDGAVQHKSSAVWTLEPGEKSELSLSVDVE